MPLREGTLMQKSAMQISDVIPDGCELSIRSWHDGVDRQYACTLTNALDVQKSWTSLASNDLQTALAAAAAAVNAPPVDRFFWKGAKSAMPINALLWVFLVLASIVIYQHR